MPQDSDSMTRSEQFLYPIALRDWQRKAVRMSRFRNRNFKNVPVISRCPTFVAALAPSSTYRRIVIMRKQSGNIWVHGDTTGSTQVPLIPSAAHESNGAQLCLGGRFGVIGRVADNEDSIGRGVFQLFKRGIKYVRMRFGFFRVV